MSKINTLNIQVSGADLQVDIVDAPSVIAFAPWTDALTLTDWQTQAGLTAIQYCNPQDSATVNLGAPDLISSIEDKTANNHDLIFESQAKLVNLVTTNGVKANVSSGTCETSVSTLSGNSWSNPYILNYVFDYSRLPTSTETLHCLASNSSDVYQTLDLTTTGCLQYTYKDDAGNTLTKTSTVVLPFDTKISILLVLERSKVRVLAHDGGDLDHAICITAEGAFNTASTLNVQSVNCKFVNGSITQQRTSGYYYGHIIAEGVVKRTFNLMDLCCQLFKVEFGATSISALPAKLVSLIQSAGAGNLATPKGDVVDLITGNVFSAVGTIDTAGDGKFHKALNIAMVASTKYLIGTVPAVWDIFNGSYGPYTLYIRHKTGTIDASSRAIFTLGSSTTAFVKIIQEATTGRYNLNVSNSIRAITTKTIASDTWYTIILKYNGTTHTFAVDDETPITFTVSNISVVNQSFIIGGAWTGTGPITIQHAGRGLLDCVALFNSALSNDELIQLRRGGNGLDGFFDYLTEYEDVVTPPSQVREYRGTRVCGTNNDNVYMCGNVATGSGATYLTFIAPRSGVLRAVTVWWKALNASGYSKGTGGTYTLSVRTDNAGVPSSTVVAEITGVGGFVTTGSSADYKKSTFTTTGSVVKGQKYHMSIINTDASPANNWVSINGTGVFGGTRAQNRPTLNNDNEWSVRLGYGQNRTTLYNNYTYYAHNALNVTFHLDKNNDGTADFCFGMPYAQPFYYWVQPNNANNAGNIATPFGGSNWIRQKMPFESGDNFIVTGVRIAAIRTGATAGNITVNLRNSANVILGTAIISAGNFARVTTLPTSTPPSWGFATFPSPISVTGGNTYYLEVSAPTTTYYPAIIQDAKQYDSTLQIASGVLGWSFGDNGCLQKSLDSGATWVNYSQNNNVQQGTKYELCFDLEVLVNA